VLVSYADLPDVCCGRHISCFADAASGSGGGGKPAIRCVLPRASTLHSKQTLLRARNPDIAPQCRRLGRWAQLTICTAGGANAPGNSAPLARGVGE